MRLYYDRPAQVWTQALPVGNGRLGAMVFGGVDCERIQLNEDSLWSGGPRNWNNPLAKEALPRLRELIAAGRHAEAERLSKETMMGPYTQSYMPLGDLTLRFYHGGLTDSYRRELDLGRGVAATIYRIGQVEYTREVFASFPDQLLVIRLRTSHKGKLSFKAQLSSPLRAATRAESDRLVLSGYCPEEVLPNYYETDEPVRYGTQEQTTAMRFEAQLQVQTDEAASWRMDHDGLHVEGASEAVLLFSAATSFNGHDRCPATEGKDAAAAAAAPLKAAAGRSGAELLVVHVADHRALYDRVQLRLGPASASLAAAADAAGEERQPAGEQEMPTDQRIAEQGASDPKLVELLFHYGRYLLIASSRHGTQPANLQGIWNQDVRPIWSSNYTLNINAQMNYWLAENCNLSECHEPLLRFIRELADNGKETARINYGTRGWCAHHNSDLWRQSAPPGDYGHGNPLWANWPMAGAWLCQHLWEHYRYTLDERYLRHEAYPVMREAALFCLDWLFQDQQGRWVTSPSTSPEHRYRLQDGRLPALSEATAMDRSLMRELFAHCVEAARTLGVDEALQRQLEEASGRLLPHRLGRHGQLQEWLEDHEDEDAHHRHVSHLYDVYPGAAMTPHRAPELYGGARVSLERRGDGGTGWSLGWKVNLWARFKEGNRALDLLSNLLQLVEDDGKIDFHRGGVYANLFDAHPPFQIDGNFGVTAGIAEMLLQSHEPWIELLPALPAAWQEGETSGLRARGGYELGFCWRDGQVQSGWIAALRGGPCLLRLHTPGMLRVECDGQAVEALRTEDGNWKILMAPQQVYVWRIEATFQGSLPSS